MPRSAGHPGCSQNLSTEDVIQHSQLSPAVVSIDGKLCSVNEDYAAHYRQMSCELISYIEWTCRYSRVPSTVSW